MDLFADIERENVERSRPLAERMRPRQLDEVIGQETVLGEGKLLRRMLLAGRLGSIILYGPPGTGKTTLARVIAQHSQSRFAELNAAGCGVKEVRAALDEARDHLRSGGERTLLFVDEIHHFNRSQQDILLPDVEKGTVTLIGATTLNPFFALNAPLVSRSQLFMLEPLDIEQIEQVLKRAIADKARGFGKLDLTVTDDAVHFLAVMCDGDARRALTALEIAVNSFPESKPIHVDKSVAEDSIQRKAIVHDPSGDEHYDLASALIKSMRGSDPDAAIYWLARMLEAGEDPRFIARRLIIFASEDIGQADPTSLLVAEAVGRAVDVIGLPECQLNLSQGVLHLATAPKSNSTTTAIAAARKDVREGRTVAVPKHLRDAHYAGAKEIGHGEGYQYPHNDPRGFVEQEYLSVSVRYYEPTEHGREKEVAERMERLRGEGESTQP
ncbi:Replication-associated recombination protein A [Planctomycetes bacterium Pan216]|uniref:Replication-associated recombination protein A n=1 Tax=Kolteria novifilia TaxID=2527975 RepID=A0A518AYK7_9BACT|nr:Replication-associated recombination protein A [Planctomycetes bacterium Pan216]